LLQRSRIGDVGRRHHGGRCAKRSALAGGLLQGLRLAGNQDQACTLAGEGMRDRRPMPLDAR
jgi:hypothetical protein